MATLSTLSTRLRAELGDIGKSFLETFTGDGVTTRFQLSQAPVQGSTLIVKVTSPTYTAIVTGASVTATNTITYTASNTFTAGQVVSISGLSTSAFNLTNVTIATRTATQFTVTNSATGAAVTAASAVAVVASTTTDVSSTAVIEEGTGVLTLAVAPVSTAVITINGIAYRYFTDSEISYYVNTAFSQHAQRTTDSNGSLATMGTLPAIDEYPLVILATSMALYTLATDSAFDIDIISPDGVNIPRSERYRQLMQMVEAKQTQYRELCSILGIGMYRIEVFTLRRISRMTNNYIPVYRPKEVDDGSIPQRVAIPMPTYGDTTPASPVTVKDLSLYAGDDFAEIVRFGMDITSYTPVSQIRLYPDIPGSQVGPVILASFTFTKYASVTGGIVDTIRLSLNGATTADLPNISYYDLQLTAPDGKVKTYLAGKVFTKAQVSIPLGPM